jgi:hypothetical protein
MDDLREMFYDDIRFTKSYCLIFFNFKPPSLVKNLIFVFNINLRLLLNSRFKFVEENVCTT